MSEMNANFQNFLFSVFVRCGRNFENKKWIESNAPYVEVTIGEETKQTSKLSNLNNPIWDETLKFNLKDLKNLPSFIKFVVKDSRILFPNLELGDFTFELDKDKLLKYQMQKEMTPFVILYDGLLNLKNTERGTLDVKILFACGDCNWLAEDKARQTTELLLNSNDSQVQYQEVDKKEYEQIPNMVFEQNEVVDNKLDEEKYKVLDQDEIHTLPTIHVKAKPRIIEKEVEYIKPIEVKETIIHREKPIIIEQPIINEKHEHYREIPQYQRNQEKIITETIHEEDVGNLDQEELKNLKEKRIEEFNDTTPIIEHEKKYVQLETDFREKPDEIREKEVIYQQPIEIERHTIENIKPTIHENVLLDKEHVYQKMAPEIQSENVQHVHQNEEFYSKDTNSNNNLNTNSN
jgi:hypothetical protein